MIRHVVLFTWNAEMHESVLADVRAGLAELPLLIPEIADYRYGPDIGVNDGNADYAVVADFASRADYLVYRDHPDHKAFIAMLGAGGFVGSRNAVQFEIDA
jgi:hypothetical protein